MIHNINKFQAKCPLPVTAAGGFSFDTTECTWPGTVNMEEWRDIPGYEGLYQVSNLGRVRSYNRMRLGFNYRSGKTCKRFYKGKIMSPGMMNGYWCLRFMKNRKYKTMSVHRAVAKSFITNPENKPKVNHIDFNTSNNNVSNLEWCTQYENIHHTIKNGRARAPKGEENGHSVLTEENVLYIRSMRGTVKNKELAELETGQTTSIAERTVNIKTRLEEID